jgi:RNA-directed DNA polymerase
LTRRNQPGKLQDKIAAVNKLLIGWINYYRYARMSGHLKSLDSWLRRKLRVIKLKQLKRCYTVVKFLLSRGVREYQCWIFALSGKGLWRKSGIAQSHHAMNLAWFKELGLTSMYDRWLSLQSNP